MRSDRVFLDTSGWVALLNTGDRNHKSAVNAWREVVRQRTVIVVTDWIVAETGNGLARTPWRQNFVNAIRLLGTSPDFQIVWINDDLLARAVALYEGRPDKTWGVVDCASFVVMTEEGIREAITADRHFEQAGFRSLLSGSDAEDGTSNGSIR